MVARVVILFPLALTAGLFPLPSAGIVTRVLMLIAVAPGVLYLARGLKRTELQWIAVSLLYLVGTCLSALYSARITEALNDFAAQVYLVVVSWLLILCLRNTGSRATYVYGMLFMAAVGTSAILGIYASYPGFSIASLVDQSQFKIWTGTVFDTELNPFSFAMVLAFLLGYPALPHRRLIIVPVTVTVLFATWVTGSRTTFFGLVFSALVVGLIVGVRKQPLWLRRTVYFLIVPGLVVANIYALSLLDNLSASGQLSNLTTGRVELWNAGLEMFADRPTTGWGARAWSHNLTHYVKIPDLEHARSYTELKAGAFHNIYLTVLAEKGLIVFIPALAMAAFLVWQSWKLHAHRKLFTGLDAGHARIAPLIITFMLVRGLGEHGGLWGYANGTADWISYAAASLIVATAARLDWAASPKRAKKGG